MNNYINVIAIVEGKTEQNFIEKILAPYLGFKNIGIRATQVSKPGQKGGDVRFSRVKKDLIIHLKQQTDTYITTFVDYYGIKEWPGLNLIKENDNPESISIKLNEGAKAEIESVFSKKVIEKRFIPFVAIHEFEALLFSHPAILSESIGIKEITVKEVIDEFGSPEAINNSPMTAPSKRLDGWCANGKFLKTTMGINIAKAIGIDLIREKCLLFNNWLKKIEEIQKSEI